MRLLFLSIIGCIWTSGHAQLSSTEIINESIAYHDPKGTLASSHFTLDLSETRPNGSDRSTEFFLDAKSAHFSIATTRDKKEIIMSKTGDGTKFLIDGRADLTAEEIKTYRLNDERLEFMKNYYRYLWMAPIVLTDPGTIVHHEVKETDFFGTPSLEIKITYDPSIGDDIWYFYFHPESYAMVGYRFYHDEAANDGEYVLLSEEISAQGVRLPKIRKWYTHKEDKLLGADHLVKLQFH